MTVVTWHGTRKEFARLQNAVARHCQCASATGPVSPGGCPAHTLLDDQNTLDHLLYVYRMRSMFIRRELYAMSARARA